MIINLCLHLLIAQMWMVHHLMGVYFLQNFLSTVKMYMLCPDPRILVFFILKRRNLG